MHILDNECSADFKGRILENDMTYKLVSHNDHRRNVAENSIQVFKDHSVSVLCGADVKFFMQLWCQILRQTENQLNLLIQISLHPWDAQWKCMLYLGRGEHRKPI